LNANIGVRMENQDKKLLAKVCKERREDLSDFVRRSVMRELGRLGYLVASERKALGIDAEQGSDERLRP
jgi:hypothetical protein